MWPSTVSQVVAVERFDEVVAVCVHAHRRSLTDCSPAASTVTRSQPNRAALGCGERGDSTIDAQPTDQPPLRKALMSI